MFRRLLRDVCEQDLADRSVKMEATMVITGEFVAQAANVTEVLEITREMTR